MNAKVGSGTEEERERESVKSEGGHFLQSLICTQKENKCVFG